MYIPGMQLIMQDSATIAIVHYRQLKSKRLQQTESHRLTGYRDITQGKPDQLINCINTFYYQHSDVQLQALLLILTDANCADRIIKLAYSYADSQCNQIHFLLFFPLAVVIRVNILLFSTGYTLCTQLILSKHR